MSVSNFEALAELWLPLLAGSWVFIVFWRTVACSGCLQPHVTRTGLGLILYYSQPFCCRTAQGMLRNDNSHMYRCRSVVHVQASTAQGLGFITCLPPLAGFLHEAGLPSQLRWKLAAHCHLSQLAARLITKVVMFTSCPDLLCRCIVVVNSAV